MMLIVRLAASGACLALFASSVLADTSPQLLSMCTQMHQWTAQQLKSLSDPEVERALCLSTKAEMLAIRTRDTKAERQCIAAVRNLLQEFTRRWPQREASEVVGKC